MAVIECTVTLPAAPTRYRPWPPRHPQTPHPRAPSYWLRPAICSASARRWKTGPTPSTSGSTRASTPAPRHEHLARCARRAGCLPASPGSEGLRHAQHARLHRRAAGHRAARPSRGGRGRRRRAGTGPGPGAARAPRLPRPGHSRFDANDAHQRRDDSLRRVAGDRASRGGPRTVDRRDRRHRARVARAAGGVRTWRAVRGLLGPMSDERVTRRPQRQPRPVCPGLSAAVSTNLRWRRRGPGRAAVSA